MRKIFKILSLSILSLGLLTSCKAISNIINGGSPDKDNDIINGDNNNENNDDNIEENPDNDGDDEIIIEKIDVYNIDDLTLLEQYPEANVELHNDIDFKNTSFNLSIEYNGIFNGNGYSIKNINNTKMIEDQDEITFGYSYYSSIFNGIGSNGVIKNVVFDNITCDLSVDTRFSSFHSVSNLTSYNYGLIENCKFNSCSIGISNASDISKFKKIYASIITGENYSSGKISNITLDDCRIHIEGVFADDDNFSNVWPGMVSGVNDGMIEDVLINNPGYYSYSIGGVAFYNKGTIKNTALLNGSFYSTNNEYWYDSEKNIGGICAINGGVVESNYLFNADIKVDNNIEHSSREYIVHPGLVGGIVANNINDAVVKSCYFEGKIKCTSSEELIEKLNIDFFKEENIYFGTFFAAGICARNTVNLYSNFSDCVISGGATGSLTCGIENTNLHQDIFSFYVRFENNEKRLNTKLKTYPNESFQEALYNESSDSVMYYYSDDNIYTDGTASWEEYLAMKGFLNENFRIGKFYPALKSDIGYENDGEMHQNLVLNVLAKRKSL